METIHGNAYDFPKYYDLLFNADCKDEIRFLEGCFERFAKRPVERLFEPACGTGRLLARLAKRGYDIAGLDLNPKAIDFCNKRLKRLGCDDATVVGDMADFRLAPKCDAAFNTINSFRHLRTEETAAAHLQCVADALRKGGIYVLGFHLTPTGDPCCDEECWSAGRGSLRVDSRMWVEGLDRRRREEKIAFELHIQSPNRQFRILDRFTFRTYTPAQFDRLLHGIPSLELAAAFDFSYDLNRPIDIDDETEDVLYVLRRL